MTGNRTGGAGPFLARGSRGSLTRHQRAILAVLRGSDCFLTAQEIHADLRNSGVRIGLTTVYRTMRVMVSDGVVDTLVAEPGETCYRSCSTPSAHHHLVCRLCRRTVEMDNPDIGAWAEDAASRHGYAELGPVVTQIFGVCEHCTA